MRKLRILLAEVVGLGILLGWLMWKYPELIDPIIPWVAWGIAWHVTWEFVLDTKLCRRGALALGKRVNRMGIWIVVFLIGGGISLLYWAGINKALVRLASLAATHKISVGIPDSTPPIRPTQSIEPPAQASKLEHPKAASKSAPVKPHQEPSLTLTASLQPEAPYDIPMLAGIALQKDYVDVRVDLINGAISIQNLDLLVGLDTSIAGIGQLSQFQGVTSFPAGSQPAMWLEGTDLQGNPNSIPIAPTPGMMSAAPVYRVHCSEVFANTIVHLVVASIAVNPVENGQLPKQLFAPRRPPRMIKVKGKYESRNGASVDNHDVEFYREF
jgi:hypothetical protein